MKKVIVIIAVLAFVLLGAAEYYIQTDAFALKIRPLVVERLKAVFGSDIEIGWVRANLIPMYLEARDISLPDDRGGQAAAIRKIKVYVNPLPLLLKKIRLTSIVLLEPRVYAERTNNGDFNFTRLVKRIQSNIGQAHDDSSSGFSFLIHTVIVNQGRISFMDRLTSNEVSVSGLQIRAVLNPSADAVKIIIKNSEIRTSAPAYHKLSGSLKAVIRYDHQRMRVESSELTSADTSVSLSGDIGSLPDVPLNLRVRLASGPQTLGTFVDFFKPKKKKDAGPHLEASAEIRGNVANPVLEGTFRFNGMTYRDILLHDATLLFGYHDKILSLSGERWKLLRGNKNLIIERLSGALGYRDQGLDIKEFEILASDLSLHITGRADFQRGFDAILKAESSDIGKALSFITTAPVEGKIGVAGSLTGPYFAPLFDGIFSAGPVTVRKIVFNKAEGRIEFRDKKINLVSVDIRQRASRYVFDGSVDFGGSEPLFSAQLKAIHSDVVSIVALFYKPIPLDLAASGELSFNGTPHNFIGHGRLAVDSGTAYGESFTRGAVTALLTTDKIEFPQVVVMKGSEGIVKGRGWIGFNGTYSANIESSGVKLSEVDLLGGFPVDGPFDLQIGSSGDFSHPKVSSSLMMNRLVYNQSEVGSFVAGLQIMDGVLTFKSELPGNPTALTARLGLHKPYPWNIEATVGCEGLDPFLLIREKDLLGHIKMVAEGTVSAQGKGTDVSTFSGNAAFNRMSLFFGDYRLDNASGIAIGLEAGRLSFASVNFSGPDTKINIAGRTDLLTDMDLTLTGTANLSLLRFLFREIEHSDGTAQVKLIIKDDWKNPEMTGEVHIRNGELKIKDIPQKFSALRGRIAFDRSRIIVDSVQGESGGGALSGSGWAQLGGYRLQNFSTRMRFENVPVRYPEGLTATLSGDLYYDGDASEQSLTGDVMIKQARYDKRVEWKSMLVDIGRGLYQRKKTEAGWIGETRLNIGFHGKDTILFQNNLAKMPLNVDLFFRGTVNQPQFVGRIEARKGLVYFRKNEFKILQASADFVDPGRINPVLDIQAETRVRDEDREYRIRLAVTGNADRAVVTLVSDPSLPDSDILALLALGKKGDELKGREQDIGISQGVYFATGQIQDMFERSARTLTGLDRFQVDPYVSKTDSPLPRVTMGKEIIQDKLFVTYSSNVGSTTPEQIFRIEYILNKHFSLVGERNEIGNTGADLKYRFEFK